MVEGYIWYLSGVTIPADSDREALPQTHVHSGRLQPEATAALVSVDAFERQSRRPADPGHELLGRSG